MSHPRPVRRPFLFALALTFIALVALQLPAFGSDRAYMEWVYTTDAQIRTAAGECYDPQAVDPEVCVELCIITFEGAILPQGEFRCAQPWW